MRPHKAMEFLAEMQQKVLAPKAIAYSLGFCACEQAKQPHEAMEPLAELQQKGRVPCAFTFSSAICPREKPSSFTRRLSSLLRCS